MFICGRLRCGWNEMTDWQLIGYYASLKFSDPPALKIPAVRAAGPTCRTSDGAGFRAPADPGKQWNRGGLSVCQTLHLVSDIPERYHIF